MNYVDDDWMFEFTLGQKERVWAQIGMFRYDLLTAEDAALEAVPGQAVVLPPEERIVW